MIVLVAVPCLVLLVMFMAACGFVLWLRARRQHHPLDEPDASMLKVPSGGDPTYGVKNLLLGDIHSFLDDLIILKSYL